MLSELEVREAFKKAPENLREFVESDELFNSFHDIRRAHNLHIDQAWNLELALHSVVLGLKSFNELGPMMKEILSGVDDTEQQAILKDLNEKIFIPLRDKTRARTEASETLVTKPSIRAIEKTLTTAPEPVTPPAAVVIEEPEVPKKSIVEQKMGAAPVQQTKVTPPATAAQPPAEQPRYHGTDPYREPLS